MKTLLKILTLGVLSLLLIGFACSYASPPGSDEGEAWTLIVESRHWEDVDVHVFCDNAQDIVRGVWMNSSQEETMRGAPCDETVFILSISITGDSYVLPSITVTPGECIEISVAERLPYSSILPCAAV